MVAADFIRGTMRLLTIGILLLAPAPASAQTLELIGEKGVTRTLAAADLAALPQVEFTSTERDGAKAVFRGAEVDEGFGNGEAHRARWIRNVARLRLVRVGN